MISEKIETGGIYRCVACDSQCFVKLRKQFANGRWLIAILKTIEKHKIRVCMPRSIFFKELTNEQWLEI